MNEFNLLSTAEKLAYCRMQLRQTRELRARIRRMSWSPDAAEVLDTATRTEQELQRAIEMFERPTLWRRINLAVNDAWARSQVDTDRKRRRTPIRCRRCSGTGRRVADAGNWFVDCECGGVVGRYDGDPEIARATEAAGRIRAELARAGVNR